MVDDGEGVEVGTVAEDEEVAGVKVFSWRISALLVYQSQ